MNRLVPLLALITAVGCASTPNVDMSEPRRVVGTENAVRIDAAVRGDELRMGVPVNITYEITNQRDTVIAIADIVPETTYDVETQIVTVNVGSEVPGEQLLPRLIAIGPGETKSFNISAPVRVLMPTGQLTDPRRRIGPNALRLKVNFLGETSPFQPLIGITQKAVHDPKLADDLFALWLEHNEVVTTSTVPMRWGGRRVAEAEATPRRPTPTRRRPGSGI